MTKKPKGTIERRRGRAFVRVTMPDGKRPRIPADHVPADKLVDFAAELGRRAAAGTLDLSRLSPPKRTTLDTIAQVWFAARQRKGMTSVVGDRARWRRWAKTLHDLDPKQVSRADIEAFVGDLDAAVGRDELAWKSAANVWGVVSRLCHDLARSKDKAVRCRDDNPADGVVAPDRGSRAARVYLYPVEMAQLLGCREVPTRWRVVYALAAYTYLRAGELDALKWGAGDRVDVAIRVQRANDRRARVVKSTKSGATRVVPIEPAIEPLLKALRGPDAAHVCRVPPKGQGWRLREHLEVAEVDRPALFARGPTERPLTLHDLRASGLTWLALRGDDALRIQRRAGHSSFSTTQLYLREAESLGRSVGAPFGPLPEGFIADVVEMTKTLKKPSSTTSSTAASGTIQKSKTTRKTEPTMGFEPLSKAEISRTSAQAVDDSSDGGER